MMDLTRHEIDGVPTLFVRTAGAVRAGLVFRVGRADETLARSGITHLIEHLALHRLGLPDYHYNGMTGPTFTTFLTQGDEQDVVKYLEAVCGRLHDLPLERFAAEKDILHTERNSRATGANEPMGVWRYGARGHGLVSYPEFGLGAITENDAVGWTKEWFTRGNVALWVTGNSLPASLKLNLPEGPRRPYPETADILPEKPAYFAADVPLIGFEGIVRRSPSAPVFARVLERELYRVLRTEGGLSYTVDVHLQTDGSDRATVTAVADALSGKHYAVLGAMNDALRRLAAGRISQDDFTRAILIAEKDLRNADSVQGLLHIAAVGVLNERPVLWIDQRLESLNEVTIEEVKRAAAEALSTGLLMVPAGLRAEWTGFKAAPIWSAGPVNGRRHRSADYPVNRWELVIGSDGVSTVCGDQAVTVHYADCEALLMLPDGARQLIASDGNAVSIEPTLWRTDRRKLSTIDRSVPAERTLMMPARVPEEVPRPRTTWWKRRRVNRLRPFLKLNPRLLGLLAVGSVAGLLDGWRKGTPLSSTLGAIALYAAAVVIIGTIMQVAYRRG